jgi:hypothetical protein
LVFGLELALLALAVEGANPGIAYHIAHIPKLFLVTEDVELGEGLGAVRLRTTGVRGVAEAGEVKVNLVGAAKDVQDGVDRLVGYEVREISGMRFGLQGLGGWRLFIFFIDLAHADVQGSEVFGRSASWFW